MTERTLEHPASPSYEQALAHQAELEKETEALAARPRYAEPVGWLRCFRGLDTLSAKILVAGIVDFRRFRRPRELIAYVGLEYSSRDAEPRGAITKTGNTPSGARSSKRPGTIATGQPSGARWPRAVRGSPPGA